MLAPPKTDEDLRQIILKQQTHYSDFTQKVIALLAFKGKTAESEAVMRLAESYGLIVTKEELRVNEHGHFEMDEMYHLIIKLLKESKGELTGPELKSKIGRRRIYAPIYYKALKDLQAEKKVSKIGYGSGIIYSLNDEQHEQKAS